MIRIPRRTVLTGAAATAGAIVTAGIPAQARADDGPIRIGCPLPLSGTSALVGRAVRLGVEVSRDYINRNGGVNGRQIEVVIRDDRGDPVQSVGAVRELNGDGINLFLGAPLTATVAAVFGVVPSLNSVFIATGSNADAFSHELFSHNSFVMADNNYARCRAFARVLATRYPDVTRWSAIFADIAAGHSVWNSMAAALKEYYPTVAHKQVEIEDPILTKYGANDFKPQISRLMASDTEGLVSVLFGDDSITFFKQARPFGLEKKIKVLCDVSVDLDLAKALGHNLPEHVWALTHWYYGGYPDNVLAQDLIKESIARNNDPAPAGITQIGHSGVRAYAAAIAAAKSTETQAVIAALETVKLETVKGPSRLRKEDHQEIGEIGVIRMEPAAGEPGWKVDEFIRTNGEDVMNPPTPGVALKL